MLNLMTQLEWLCFLGAIAGTALMMYCIKLRFDRKDRTRSHSGKQTCVGKSDTL